MARNRFEGDQHAFEGLVGYSYGEVGRAMGAGVEEKARRMQEKKPEGGSGWN